MSLRVALFGSHYYGLAMLESLLSLQQRFPEIEIVGVASDDPTKEWVSPQKRLWRHPHMKEEEEMVAGLATRQGIPVWRGRVKTEEFQAEFKEWMPDVCYMGVFGQKIPENIWSSPLYGFYNFHSCAGDVWPSNTGAQAFESMTEAGERRISTAMHVVDNEFDHGPLVAFSRFMPFFPEEAVMDTFKRTSPLIAELVTWHVCETLGVPSLKNSPRVVVAEQMTHIRGPASLTGTTGLPTRQLYRQRFG